LAEAFARFPVSPAAQRAFVVHGFRPVTPEGTSSAKGKFPEIKSFTVVSFGGWEIVKTKFFGKGEIRDQLSVGSGMLGALATPVACALPESKQSATSQGCFRAFGGLRVPWSRRFTALSTRALMDWS
jgi:hypothetical protein